MVKDPRMCGYIIMPRINEWVAVKMAGPGVRPLRDIPIHIEGRRHVGEMDENGYLTGLHLLDGEKLGGGRAAQCAASGKHQVTGAKG